MTAQTSLRVLPTDDRAWLLAAVRDALHGGAPVLPVPASQAEAMAARFAGVPLPEGTAVVLHTSGSSGVPKSVALSAEALLASAAATHERLGGPGQWLVALPTHLVSGVQMLVRSVHAGTTPVFADGSFTPEAFLERSELLTAERRYTSLVPVQLARVLDLAERDPEAAERLRAFDAVLVGGQAVTLSLRQRAHQLGVSLRRSYGMTETAGGCVYDGVEIGDVSVRIRGGEVQLAGPTLALGYLGDEALTADRFVWEGADRWYRTGDSGHLLGGMLTVTGRLDRVIVSGGTNVSLDEVERVLAEVPGWESSVAVGVADPVWGERAAVLVGASGREAADEGTGDAADEATAVAALRRALGPAGVPVRVLRVAEVPRLPGGKPDRHEVARLLAG